MLRTANPSAELADISPDSDLIRFVCRIKTSRTVGVSPTWTKIQLQCQALTFASANTIFNENSGLNNSRAWYSNSNFTFCYTEIHSSDKRLVSPGIAALFFLNFDSIIDIAVRDFCYAKLKNRPTCTTIGSIAVLSIIFTNSGPGCREIRNNDLTRRRIKIIFKSVISFSTENDRVQSSMI